MIDWPSLWLDPLNLWNYPNQTAMPYDLEQAYQRMLDSNNIARINLPEITHVAIKQGDTVFSLPKPHRHSDIDYAAIRGAKSIPGYLDSNGVFLDEKQALSLAKENGQLRFRPSTYVLASEDLW